MNKYAAIIFIAFVTTSTQSAHSSSPGFPYQPIPDPAIISALRPAARNINHLQESSRFYYETCIHQWTDAESLCPICEQVLNSTNEPMAQEANDLEEGPTCVICQNLMSNHDSLTFTCSHTYHLGCILQRARSDLSCPICHANLASELRRIPRDPYDELENEEIVRSIEKAHCGIATGILVLTLLALR